MPLKYLNCHLRINYNIASVPSYLRPCFVIIKQATGYLILDHFMYNFVDEISEYFTPKLGCLCL